MNHPITIFWYRRDLRTNDNTGLYHALKEQNNVLPIFIFDTSILHQLQDKKDARVSFIHQTLEQLKKEFQQQGSDLKVFHGDPIDIFSQLLQHYTILKVYTNHDYEGYGKKRDAAIKALLEKNQIPFNSFKDQVIFERREICKDDGLPYTIFTPYSKKWKAKLEASGYREYDTKPFFVNLYQQQPEKLIPLADISFLPTSLPFPKPFAERSVLQNYTKERDFPAIRGTSHLGIHLRFGTISIRSLVQIALQVNETFLNELIWRDFYQMICDQFPHINEGLAFKKQYDFIQWRDNPADFEKWCAGKTGYPIVDAGMRELNETGFMHNRVRMIVASFLTKHLLIDWRLGEAYFAQKLLDFDFAANNGGWQWASSSGCDAAPYFRIFNPTLQTKRFDPELKYIRKWVPELETMDYPAPIVVHEFARKRCLEVYAAALKK